MERLKEQPEHFQQVTKACHVACMELRGAMRLRRAVRLLRAHLYQ